MAGYSARQSTFTTGDTILAAHSNDEFNQVLAAFNATTGHTHDGTAGEGGPIKSLRDANSYNKIAIDDSNNHLEFSVNVSNNSVEQVKIQDGAIVPVTDDDIDLGTSSLEFKNAFFDGTVEADAITVGGTNITSLFAGLSSNTFTGNIEIDVASGDPTIILDTQGADKFHIAVDDSDSDNLVVKSGGTVGSGSGLKLDSSGNLIVDGDLTVSGDDITMGTNTAGNLLIADGTNFNSIAVGSLSEISTVASDDVFLAVDTSGGGLKKITRSTMVSGLATSGAISNVVEDTTPQLGGNLDMNGQDIVTTSNADLELAPNGTGHVTVRGNTNSGAIQFNCESNSHGQILKAQPHSASVTNEMLLPAGSNSTLVSLVSTDTLENKTLTTPVINAGAQLKNGSTSAGFLEFFEDSDNGTNKVTLIGPASTSDITLTLPATAGTLVGTGDSGTLPLAAIDIDGGTDIGADLTTSDLIVVDDGAGGTNRKAALSRVVTLMTAQGFTTDDPTALAIALG
jgi:hypothetical protein